MALTSARNLQPQTRVIVFIDGQNVYKASKERFGHGYCHPLLLARELAGARRLVGVRYYSGIHDPNVNPTVHGSVDRRHKLIQRCGVTVIERQLAYRWEWGYDPRSFRKDPRKNEGSTEQVELRPYKKAREKGIDVALALDVVDLAVNDRMDTAIVVSEDGDLTEVARVVHATTSKARRVSVEGAVVNARRKPIVLGHYDFTHQIGGEMFDRCRDDMDYKAPLDRPMVDLWLQITKQAAAPGCI